MSWQLRIARAPASDIEREVEIEYFDSEDPEVVLHREIFTVPTELDDDAVIDRAQGLGRSERAKRSRRPSPAPLEGRVEPIDRRS